MRLMVIAPNTLSSGEAVTALHMADAVRARGGSVHFVGSAFTHRLFSGRCDGATVLDAADAAANGEAWRGAVASFRPDVALFADYPMCHFRHGSVPLKPGLWLDALGDTASITLDHLGLAQTARSMRWGPKSLPGGRQQVTPAPAEMGVLLPCPVIHPRPTGWRGQPFRYWQPPTLTVEARAELRGRYVHRPDARLILFPVPTWAEGFANQIRYPIYRALTRLLKHYLKAASVPVTVLSVNSGSALAPLEEECLAVRNIRSLPPADYEGLLASCDLLLTDNAISVSLGKAAQAGVPGVVLQSSHEGWSPEVFEEGLVRETAKVLAQRPGGLFPHRAFPIFDDEQLDELGVLDGNPLVRATATVEVFGGSKSATTLVAALEDTAERAALQAGAEDYRRAIERLPDAWTALEGAISRAPVPSSHA